MEKMHKNSRKSHLRHDATMPPPDFPKSFTTLILRTSSMIWMPHKPAHLQWQSAFTQKHQTRPLTCPIPSPSQSPERLTKTAVLSVPKVQALKHQRATHITNRNSLHPFLEQGQDMNDRDMTSRTHLLSLLHLHAIS